jgi:cyanophycinase
MAMAVTLALLMVGMPAAAQGRRGSLVIVGGGTIGDSINARFVRLAGGEGKARIVVLPMASADGERGGVARARIFERLGARAVSLNLTRATAESDSVARLLAEATGIWFPGGDQSRLTSVLLGTRALDSVRARFRAGAVVGGTSAGAAVMSDPMITGEERRPGGARVPADTSTPPAFVTIDRDNIVVAPGFGLLEGVVIDQHFLRRRRHNRLLSRAVEAPEVIGVGIDESTALIVDPDGRWEVIGASQVVVYDARKAQVPRGAGIPGASGVVVHILPPGARWSPASGTAPTLPLPER